MLNKYKSLYYFLKFKHYRNKLNHLLRLSKRKYYNIYFFLKNVNNSRRVRSGVKQRIHFKPLISQRAVKITYNDISDRNSCFAGTDQRTGSGVWWELWVICCTNSDPLEI